MLREDVGLISSLSVGVEVEVDLVVDHGGNWCEKITKLLLKD